MKPALPALLSMLAIASGLSAADQRPPRAQAVSHPVLAAVGDISRCDSDADDATAALAAEVPGTIAALGDLVEGKAPDEYRDCFEPSWGGLRARIRPTPGDNGEYGERGFPQLDDYRDYFGDAAVNNRGETWYGYEYGTWQVISLDSSCVDQPEGCRADSPQVQWLKATLADNPSRCTAVYSHHPMLDKPGRGTRGSLEALLNPLYEAGVDLWLAGHRHTYRRYAPVGLDGERDDHGGIRQFIVGTGGHTRNEGGADFEEPHGVLEATNGDTWGVLRLTLKPGGYDWHFVPAAVPGSGDYSDSGSGTCHGDEPPPTTSMREPSPPADPGTGTSPPSRPWPTSPPPPAPTQPAPPAPSGYWVLAATGTVSGHGDAAQLGAGGPGRLLPGETATSLAATPSGGGYWIFTSQGRVLPFGDAPHFGDMGKETLNRPVVDAVATPSGRGYYLVADDGGIFTFGDAGFSGSMGRIVLNAPVVSLAPDPDGTGYWLVAADGGVFAFDAPFRGSMGSEPKNRPVTGMVAFGSGYLMVATDGGIFNFSDRPFHGSLGNNPPPHPVVALAALS